MSIVKNYFLEQCLIKDPKKSAEGADFRLSSILLMAATATATATMTMAAAFLAATHHASQVIAAARAAAVMASAAALLAATQDASQVTAAARAAAVMASATPLTSTLPVPIVTATATARMIATASYRSVVILLRDAFNGTFKRRSLEHLIHQLDGDFCRTSGERHGRDHNYQGRDQ